MAGPWEQYQAAPSQDGPWSQYATPKDDGKPVKSEEKKSGFVDSVTEYGKQRLQEYGDMAAGAVRGAGSIGSTILTLADARNDFMRGDLKSLSSRYEQDKQRRQGIDDGLKSMGAQTDSFNYGAGKLTGEIAGTAGAGPLLSLGARSLGAAPSLVNALSTSGMKAATLPQGANLLAQGANMLTRTIGGGVVGGVSAGLVDPSQAKMGTLAGAALPGLTKLGGEAGNYLSQKMEAGANRLMQSAIKPTIEQLKKGDAGIAVKALLERGINPNAAGVNKLRELISGVDDQIAGAISNSNKTVSKQKVLAALDDVSAKFGNQVSPTADINAIRSVADDFAAHPALTGDAIPVQTAQSLKQGTYKVLSKKYGQLGGAETEAQKGLARGLKEGIAEAVPEIQGLNAEQSKLLTTLKVTERRALMEMNKNPMGLAALAQNPISWAMFMADKSALFKSVAARMLNTAATGAGKSFNLLENSARLPIAGNALTRTYALPNEVDP